MVVIFLLLIFQDGRRKFIITVFDIVATLYIYFWI